MTPRPRGPRGNGGDGGGDGPPGRRPGGPGGIEPSKGITSAQQAVADAAAQGRPGNAGQGTPQGAAPSTTQPQALPPNRAGTQDLESATTPQDGGLINDVGGQPVDGYLHDRATARAEDLRAMRENGQISATETGPVSAVGIDRRTGAVVEGVNGRPRDTIPEDQLHPVLRERLEQMRAGGPYPQYNKDGTPLMRDGEQVMSQYPHGDNPLRHAEVKVANELLWRRGADADASALGEFQMDTQFPFGEGGLRGAPYCANCNRLLDGVPSNAGRVTHGPGHPDQQFLPR